MSIKLTALGHASYIFAVDGFTLLTDPVFFDPFESSSNQSFPNRTIAVESLPRLDAILLSHRHMDHFDPLSLSVCNKDATVFIPPDDFLRDCCVRLGFERIVFLRAGQKVSNGRIAIFGTPSMVDFPEIGYAVSDSENVVWNTVDSVLNEDLVAEVVGLIGRPDVLLATHNPLIQDELHRMPFGAAFPFDKYAQLLKNIIAADAKLIIPSANGFCFSEVEWMNSRGFPVSPVDFVQDMNKIRPGSAVELLYPGESLVLDGSVQRTREPVPFLACNVVNDDYWQSWFAANDGAIPSMKGLAARNPKSTLEDLEAITTYLHSKFIAELIENIDARSLRDLVEFGVRWKLVLVSDHGEYDHGQWEIDFGARNLAWSSKAIRPNLVSYVHVSAIVDILNSSTSLYGIYGTDRIRILDRVYCTSDQGISRPQFHVPEPLTSIMDLHRKIDESYAHKLIDDIMRTIS